MSSYCLESGNLEIWQEDLPDGIHHHSLVLNLMFWLEIRILTIDDDPQVSAKMEMSLLQQKMEGKLWPFTSHPDSRVGGYTFCGPKPKPG